MTDPKNIANLSAAASVVSHMADRSVPNWGKVAPIPELEGVINLLNSLRAVYPQGPPGWRDTKTKAMAKAHRLLEVEPDFYAAGGWNATVAALDHYRDDWRGAILLTLGEALAYVGHKNALPPGITEADLESLVMHLGGTRYQLSRDGWAKLRQLEPAAS